MHNLLWWLQVYACSGQDTMANMDLLSDAFTDIGLLCFNLIEWNRPDRGHAATDYQFWHNLKQTIAEEDYGKKMLEYGDLVAAINTVKASAQRVSTPQGYGTTDDADFTLQDNS